MLKHKKANNDKVDHYDDYDDERLVGLEHTCTTPTFKARAFRSAEATPHNDNQTQLQSQTQTLTQQTVTYSPYNELNREITLNDVQSILKDYGLPGDVRNVRLYQRAFVHKSYTKKPHEHNELMNVDIGECPHNCIPLYTKSNERLEFIGDGVLECITKYYLYKRFPKEDEGFMTEKKIALVKNEHIGRLAIDMRLQKWFVMSRNAEEKNTRSNLKKLGCLFEAFLGALFLDSNGLQINDPEEYFGRMFLTGPGFQMAQLFIENVFDRHVNWSSIVHVHDNYKNTLQEFIQKRFRVTPLYIIIDQGVCFEMGVFLLLGKTSNPSHLNPKNATAYSGLGSWEKVNDHYERYGFAFIFLAKASHKIKKKAEQLACKAALSLIQ